MAYPHEAAVPMKGRNVKTPPITLSDHAEWSQKMSDASQKSRRESVNLKRAPALHKQKDKKGPGVEIWRPSLQGVELTSHAQPSPPSSGPSVIILPTPSENPDNQLSNPLMKVPSEVLGQIKKHFLENFIDKLPNLALAGSSILFAEYEKKFL